MNNVEKELDIVSYLSDTSKSEFVRRAVSTYCNLLRYAPEVIEEIERRDEYGRTN